MQWPLGWLSDRHDRRAVMVGAALTTVIGGLVVALPFGLPIVPLALLIAVAVGGCQAVYAIAVAHAFDFAGSERSVALSSSLMLVWGAGATLGPLAAAGAIDRLGPQGLFVHASVFSLAFVGFALWRMTRRKPRPPAERMTARTDPRRWSCWLADAGRLSTCVAMRYLRRLLCPRPAPDATGHSADCTRCTISASATSRVYLWHIHTYRTSTMPELMVWKPYLFKKCVCCYIC